MATTYWKSDLATLQAITGASGDRAGVTEGGVTTFYYWTGSAWALSSMNGSPRRITITTDTVLTVAQCTNTLIDNYGQAAAMTLTLPLGFSELNLKFQVATTGYAIHIKAGATSKHIFNGVPLDNADKISNAAPAYGDTLTIHGLRSGAATYDYETLTALGAWADGGA